ncbi:MAG: FIST C-terminal domain-containing protein [Pirellulaceae bacterium]|nr:FIST C-terminal domain-containing protein [Pirellulaceae bacterium]
MAEQALERQSRFASALSTREALADAVREAADRSLEQLGGPPDLAVAFVSPLYSAGELERLPEQLCQRLGSERLLGCTGESIVGTGREVEGQPALSLWLARLPGTRLTPLALQFERTPDGGSIVGWPHELDGAWPDGAHLLALGEPYTFPADLLLERMNEDRPGVPIVGGMASGGLGPGENRLFLGPRTLDGGAVACLVAGGVHMETVVSQGCRPIGRPLVVTKAERNIVYQLGGRPALEQLREMFAELPNREQQLVQQGLHLGRVVNEYQDHFEQGDFLVRNVIGFQPQEGALAVGDYMRAGQTVQFHVRDQQTADAELRTLLARRRQQRNWRAALLFTCNGRGTRLFDQPDHDAACVASALGQLPLAGLFAQGEIGPIAGKNFLHGFTASLALFADDAPSGSEPA